MPKARIDVDYGPVWDDLVEELGQPLGGEPTHSDEPQLDRSDADVYGPFVTDHDDVVVEYVPWPDDLSDELAEVVRRLTYPPVEAAVDGTIIAPAVGELGPHPVSGLDLETHRLMIDALDATDTDKTIIITRREEDRS